MDIGVFAHNGAHFSAPGFVTVFYPDNERRTYGPDGTLRAIDYEAVDLRIGTPTEAIFSFKGARYDITDFEALLHAAAQGEDLGAKMLQAELSDQARAFLAKARAGFGKAKKAHAAEWKRATEYKAMHHVERRRYVKAANRKAAAPLLEEDPALGASAKEVLEAALNRLLANPGLYVDHAAALDALADAPGRAKHKRAFVDQRKRLVAWGLLAQTEGGGYAFGPALAENNGPPEKMDAFLRHALGTFHMVVLREILFPGMLNVRPHTNYVDRALGTGAPWCDVYVYDADGRACGWRRFGWPRSGRPGPDVFTARGHCVLEQDEEAGTAVAAAVETYYEAVFRHRRKRGHLGKVVFTPEDVAVFGPDGKRWVDPAGAGKSVDLDQVRFVLEGARKKPADKKTEPPVRADILTRDTNGALQGWTRYGGEAPVTYEKTDHGFAPAGEGGSDPAEDITVGQPETLSLGWRTTEAHFRYEIRPEGGFTCFEKEPHEDE